MSLFAGKGFKDYDPSLLDGIIVDKAGIVRNPFELPVGTLLVMCIDQEVFLVEINAVMIDTIRVLIWTKKEEDRSVPEIKRYSQEELVDHNINFWVLRKGTTLPNKFLRYQQLLGIANDDI